jgi:hypothetical protein
VVKIGERLNVLSAREGVKDELQITQITVQIVGFK